MINSLWLGNGWLTEIIISVIRSTHFFTVLPAAGVLELPLLQRMVEVVSLAVSREKRPNMVFRFIANNLRQGLEVTTVLTNSCKENRLGTNGSEITIDVHWFSIVYLLTEFFTVISERRVASSIQYGSGKCGTHARVVTTTLAHGNSKKKIKQKRMKESTKKNENGSIVGTK